MISPSSPRVQVTSVTAVSGSAQYRAIVPPVASVSSSGCACTSRSLRRVLLTAALYDRACCALVRDSDERLLLGVVAGHRVPLAAVDQLGDVVGAAGALVLGELVRELRAPGAEPAAAGRVGRARHVADHGDPVAGPLLARVGQRDRRDQRLGV